MCGITAALIKTSNTKYWDLLKASEIRGQDGTGYTIMKKDGSFFSFHSPLKASLLTEFPLLEAGDFVIGQNRLAIFGQTQENNQPLHEEFMRLSLVHNGNLYDFEKVFTEMNLKRSFQVDTELILRLLQKFKLEWGELKSSIAATIERIKGNYACMVLDGVYPDKAALGVFVQDKPLWMAEDETGLYFFSTERIGKKVFPELYEKQLPRQQDLYHSENCFCEVPNFATFIIYRNLWMKQHIKEN
jgi:glutamine phosphoribosylpyrophosphate amidotransferase